MKAHLVYQVANQMPMGSQKIGLECNSTFPAYDSQHLVYRGILPVTVKVDYSYHV